MDRRASAGGDPADDETIARAGDDAAAPTASSGRRRTGVPAAVRAVAVAAVLEAVGLAAVAGWGITQLVSGTETDLGVGLFMVVFALALAGVLVVSARALLAGRRSGRSPIATWQLLQGATGFAVGSATGVGAAWVVVAVSAVVFVLLMTPAAVAHVVGRPAG